jgi:hypothetical protein
MALEREGGRACERFVNGSSFGYFRNKLFYPAAGENWNFRGSLRTFFPSACVLRVCDIIETKGDLFCAGRRPIISKEENWVTKWSSGYL